MKHLFAQLFIIFLCLFHLNGTASTATPEDDSNQTTKLICEEVKLTRDLYNGLLEQWDIRRFQKMAKNKHRILNILLRYLGESKNDPQSIRPSRGLYRNVGLKKKYHELSAKGAKSTKEAINVLLEAEQMLLYDLSDIKPLADDEKLIEVYNKIEKQTEKHIEQLKKMQGKNLSTLAFSN
ncbi:DUF2202 domain-containing protein [Sediminitomix flava]|uniref:Uncharacterized protein DUF2202 n=1 Tax=Sediminitomix flava TaxID=379075 RepID=A0A315ZGS0_SEDFL|nr:DUF2202 domain-containing protein [Sediminitomix flava]PWJ44711.1 uncharacterized protein DUF2202 [Sediminitomix flava]